MSTLVKTDALGGDPTFSPVRKLAPELLSEIFLLCMPTLPEPVPEPDESLELGYGMDLQAARAPLARVCRWWNTVLNNDPRAWATLALDEGRSITPEIVTLWIKRSKSHPLDVYIGFGNRCNWEDACPIDAVVLTQLWRIRCLVWRMSSCYRHPHLSTLLPHSVSTRAPMLQNLSFIGHGFDRSSNLGDIHCPDLRTLTIEYCDQVIKSLIGKSMPNVRHLRLISNGPLHIELFHVLPNLVSLKWIQWVEHVEAPEGKVTLQSLKSLTLAEVSPQILTCFYAPSLESLNLTGDAAELIDILKIIRHDWNVTLRHLTITGQLPEETAIYTMLPYLTHLETLIVLPEAYNSVDELLIALLPTHNRDFTLACPQLKMMEINRGRVSTSALVDFVWQRVKPDLVDLVPGLMTSLKLSCIHVDQDMCEQLVNTHGSSVHIRFNSQTFIHLCKYPI